MRCLRKEARLSQDFNVVASPFQMMGAATSETPVLRFHIDNLLFRSFDHLFRPHIEAGHDYYTPVHALLYCIQLLA